MHEHEQSDLVQVTLKLPADMRHALAHAAQAEHRTLSGQARFLIAMGLENFGAARPQQEAA